MDIETKRKNEIKEEQRIEKQDNNTGNNSNSDFVIINEQVRDSGDNIQETEEYPEGVPKKK